MKTLMVTSPAFAAGGRIPERHTGYGADISPALHLEGLDPQAQSLVLLLDDLDHPIPAYSHWVLWNLPAEEEIPEDIVHGEKVPGIPEARQGYGYGKHRYRGPKPPFHWSHRYRFTVYALDTLLDLPATARKRDVLRAMRGHILQQGELVGHYR